MTAGRQAVVWWLGYALVAAVTHPVASHFNAPLTATVDLDGLKKLEGIAADPSLGAMLGYFIGDDPQRVHTFRPLPAAGLWLQYHLWGVDRRPYLVVQLLLFGLTALAVARLARRIGLSEPVCRLAGLLTVAVPTRQGEAVLRIIATQHDLLCTLFALLALERLLAWLDEGERRALAASAGWMLLAYLSKEMALALVPLAGGLALFCRAPAERRAQSIGAALGVAAVWFVWYRLAEQNMAPADRAHTFAGLWELFSLRWQNSLANALWSLCRPVGHLAYLARSAAGWSTLTNVLFYEVLFDLGVQAAWITLLWRNERRLLAVILLWRAAAVLPVLPLNSIFAWHDYMPQILDGLLYAAGCVVLAQRLEQDHRWAAGLFCWRVVITAVGATFAGAQQRPWWGPETVLCDLLLTLWVVARCRRLPWWPPATPDARTPAETLNPD